MLSFLKRVFTPIKEKLVGKRVEDALITDPKVKDEIFFNMRPRGYIVAPTEQGYLSGEIPMRNYVLNSFKDQSYFNNHELKAIDRHGNVMFRKPDVVSFYKDEHGNFHPVGVTTRMAQDFEGSIPLAMRSGSKDAGPIYMGLVDMEKTRGWIGDLGHVSPYFSRGSMVGVPANIAFGQWISSDDDDDDKKPTPEQTPPDQTPPPEQFNIDNLHPLVKYCIPVGVLASGLGLYALNKLRKKKK